jgi:hypothetical protein
MKTLSDYKLYLTYRANLNDDKSLIPTARLICELSEVEYLITIIRQLFGECDKGNLRRDGFCIGWPYNIRPPSGLCLCSKHLTFILETRNIEINIEKGE